MSKGNSAERARMMRALGAEVVLVDQAARSVPGQVSGEDLQLVEAKAKSLTQTLGAFRADQFQHRGSFRGHYLHTGPEMWRQAGSDKVHSPFSLHSSIYVATLCRWSEICNLGRTPRRLCGFRGQRRNIRWMYRVLQGAEPRLCLHGGGADAHSSSANGRGKPSGCPSHSGRRV
jgi:hypothetical protein